MKTTLRGVPGFLARPAGDGPWPTLIVVQEWWGLDDQTERIAGRFAAAGYLSFAPDLYRGDLAALGDNNAAMSFMQKHLNHGPSDMQVVFDALQGHPDSTGKVGSVGFCFGGRMSLALGTSRPLNAVCTFYGGQMQQLFEKMSGWRIPTLGFFGDADTSIPPGTIEQFKQLLDQSGVEHSVTVYPDSGHAFFRDCDPTVYKPGPSRDAWEKTLSFFGRHLARGTPQSP